jgi:hypothetical protein
MIKTKLKFKTFTSILDHKSPLIQNVKSALSLTCGTNNTWKFSIEIRSKL